MPIHENSLKNLRPGRKKGSKNKKKLTKEDVKKLIDQTEDLKIKAKANDLSKDDLVEVLVKAKKSAESVEKKENPVKSNPSTLSDDEITELRKLRDDALKTHYEAEDQPIVNQSRKVTIKEFFFGIKRNAR
jgi:hypothetical protein